MEKNYERLVMVTKLATSIFSRARIKDENYFFVPDPFRYWLMMNILQKLPIGTYKEILGRVLQHRKIYYTFVVSSELSKVIDDESSNSEPSPSVKAMKDFVKRSKTWAQNKINEIFHYTVEEEKDMILRGNLAPLSYSFVDQELHAALTLLPKYDNDDRVKKKLMRIIFNYVKNQKMSIDPANISWALVELSRRNKKVDGYVKEVLTKARGNGEICFFEPDEGKLRRELEKGDVTPEIYGKLKSTLFFLVDARDLLNSEKLNSDETKKELEEIINKAEAWLKGNMKKDDIISASIYLHYILMTPTGQTNKSLYIDKMGEAYNKMMNRSKKVKRLILITIILIPVVLAITLIGGLPQLYITVINVIPSAILGALVSKLLELSI